MGKKIGKVVVFGLVAGAAAAGVYHYLQNKNKQTEDFEDFDLDDFEGLDETEAPKERNYVSLDNAKVIVNDTIGKAKEAIVKASKKIQATLDESADITDDDATYVEFDETAAPAEETSGAEEVKEETAAEEKAKDEVPAEDSTEEFFDDDEE